MIKKPTKLNSWCCCCNSGSYLCGIFLIIIGGYYLARNLGFIPSDFPFWPILLLIFGVYLLMKNSKK